MGESGQQVFDHERQVIEIQRIGSRAVRKAQEESRRLGVPNVYSINGIIYYELPNGELTTVDPFDEGMKTDRQAKS